MIGSGLKKYAQANGLTVAKGVAYGSLKGYAVTLSEGSGYKQIVITTKFADPEKPAQLQALINGKNVSREYRVQNLTLSTDGIAVIFTDTVGTMKKLEAFVDWFFPLLPEYSATPAHTCTECGGMLTGGCWKLINGVAYHMHESCAEKLKESLKADDDARTKEASGSYGLGLLGALVGSAIGGVVWALVLMLGYMASIVGLLIGWLAEKGYDLLKGKQGKGKVAILILAVIFGVVFGNVLSDVIYLVGAVEELGYTVADIPALMVLLFKDSEYMTTTLLNIALGLLFAGLGVFALLRKTGENVADTKFIDLP